jgi:hypothetical protein
VGRSAPCTRFPPEGRYVRKARVVRDSFLAYEIIACADAAGEAYPTVLGLASDGASECGLQNREVVLELYTQTGVRYVRSCYSQNLLFLRVEARTRSTLEGL